MRLTTIDFETYWAAGHSLNNMTPIEYIMHPDTQIISCSVKHGEEPAFVLFGSEVDEWIEGTDFSDRALLAHNAAEFDALVLAWRYGVVPKLWMDTQAMARPIFAKTVGLSLKKLCTFFGLGTKDNSALLDTKGKRLQDFTAEDVERMRVYNGEDSELCYRLFKKLRPYTTTREMWLIDTTIRMAAEPKFEVDVAMLDAAQSIERSNKTKYLLEAAQAIDETVEDIDHIEEELRKIFASAPKFGRLLTALNVAVPMKPSPAVEGKMIPALAKTDDAFVALAEHEDPRVAAAAQARLSVRSTIVETRLQRFKDAATLMGGRMPIGLRYCGADTTGRWSGIFKLNHQNMPRIDWSDARNPANAMRMCLKAPPGYSVYLADLSGIEMRINMFLWRVPYAMELLTADPEHADLYKQLASDEFGVPYDEVTDAQRRAAKAQILGCGYGLGTPSTFVTVARTMAGIHLTEAEAGEGIQEFRRRHQEIRNGWYRAQDMLPKMQQGVREAVDPWGLVHTAKNSFVLPSGRRIFYPQLRSKDDGYWPSGDRKVAWLYGSGRHMRFVWGGLLVENCVSEGTLVLSERGWIPVETVCETDRIHDGVEFVHHGGLVYKSVQPCVKLDGVFVTPDHEVLTDDGWQEASLVRRPYRPNLRGVGGRGSRVHGRQALALEVPLSVWQRHSAGGEGDCPARQAGADTQLRVSHQGPAVSGEDARHVPAPGLRGVAEHVRQVQAAIASGVAQLWGAWHPGVRQVAGVLSELLAGHGRHVPAWAGPEPHRQRRGLHATELRMGAAPGQRHEQTQHSHRGGRARVGQEDGHQPLHSVLQGGARVAHGQAHRPTVAEKPVYDILNCGPRQRFVVLGDSGPMVFHNCVQAMARDILADNIIAFYKQTGQRPIHTVHDEPIYMAETQKAEGLLVKLNEIMRTPPAWWPELAVWSEGGIGKRYGEIK